MGKEFIKQLIVGKFKQDGGHKPSLGEGSKQYLCARDGTDCRDKI